MKKVFLILGTAMFFSLSLSGQVLSSTYGITLNLLLSHSVPELSVAQVKEMKDVLWLDAREKNEYTVSHIANAKFVGYDQFNIEELKTIDPNQKIVVYCSVGYRSEKIAEKIMQGGFKDVSNLYGGIFEWINQENTVVNSQGETTENIHAYSKAWGVWLNKGNKVYDSK
jgi:rhodanese-related sulfurtransferase